MKRSRITVAALLPCFVGGCHAYASSNLEAVSSGDRVRALLTQEQFAEFEEHLPGAGRRIEGTVVEADSSGMLVEVPVVTVERGIRLDSYHQRLRIPARGIADLEMQSLDRLRTWSLVGLAAAGVGVVVWDQVVGRSRRGAEPTPGPPAEDIAIVLRLPFLDD